MLHIERNRRLLPGLPQIGTQRGGLDLPARGVVNRRGQRPTAHMNTELVKVRERPMDGSGRHTASGRDFDGGMARGHGDLHVLKCPTKWDTRKGQSPRNGEIAENGTNAQTCGMARPRKPREEDPWKQRDYFMSLVDKKLEEGHTLQAIAKALGLTSTDSLETKYRYDHKRIPKRTTIEKAARFFGVDPSDLYGGAKPETEAEIARAFLVQGGMGREELEPLTDQVVIEAWRVALATARAVLAK